MRCAEQRLAIRHRRAGAFWPRRRAGAEELRALHRAADRDGAGRCARALCWHLLRPQKIDLTGRKTWCVSQGPDFAAKAAEIVGLYLHPPDGALVVARRREAAYSGAAGWLGTLQVRHFRPAPIDVIPGPERRRCRTRHRAVGRVGANARRGLTWAAKAGSCCLVISDATYERCCVPRALSARP